MNSPKRLKPCLRVPVAAILIVVTGSLSCLLYGQQYNNFASDLETMKRMATLRIGPFLVYPRFGMGYGYNNNVYGKTAAQGTDLGRWVYFSLPITVYLPFRDWLIFDVGTALGYDYFFDLKKERAPSFNLVPRVKMLLFHRIVATGSLRSSRNRYRVSSQIDQPVWLNTSGYSLDLFYDTPRQTSIGFSGYLTHYKYESVTLQGAAAPLNTSLNREEKGGKLEFYYPLNPGTFFFANVGATEYRFEYAAGNFRDSYSYQVYSGIRFPLLGRATGTISLGFKKLIPKQAQYIGFSGFVGDTSVVLRTGRFAFRVGFGRDIPFSFSAKTIYYIDTNGGAGISIYVSQRIRLDYDFRYGYSKYPPEEAVSLAANGQQASARLQEDLRDHSFGFVYRIFRTTGIGLKADYYDRYSIFYSGRIKRLTYGVNLTYQF
jgi:hypothetical protein